MNANGQGLIALGLVAGFIAAVSTFAGIVDWVVTLLPTVAR